MATRTLFERDRPLEVTIRMAFRTLYARVFAKQGKLSLTVVETCGEHFSRNRFPRLSAVTALAGRVETAFVWIAMT